jgi:FAD dependent oxidoreductase TIGR03364
MDNKTAVVVGAGIVGLAAARALSVKGYSVKVFDRNPKAVGASVRNFGMLWPIGQPAGVLYKRAMRSREIWKEVAGGAGIWLEETGSLHLAYHAEEWTVLKELEEIFRTEGRKVNLLDAEAVTSRYGLVNNDALLGGLYSADEMLVDPREAIAALPGYLENMYDVKFFWGKCVSYVADRTVYIGNDEEHEFDIAVVCSGADFETLYPEAFAKLPITKCKLQMLRTVPMPESFRLKTAICGGLSLLHYHSFKAAPSLPLLRQKMETDMRDYLEAGIHVMAAQNGRGEITIGDSHEYGMHLDPFDRQSVNKQIMDYLAGFLKISSKSIAETWHGVYPKLTNGDTEIFMLVEDGVYLLNGVGGAGMTLSFGLAEEVVAQIAAAE